jgi:hypothetical protein
MSHTPLLSKGSNLLSLLPIWIVYHNEHLFATLIYKISKISDSRENRDSPFYDTYGNKKPVLL